MFQRQQDVIAYVRNLAYNNYLFIVVTTNTKWPDIWENFTVKSLTSFFTLCANGFCFKSLDGEFSCKQSLHTFSPVANGLTFRKELSKIFSRNAIKVSYSCLPNVKQTISNNNNDRLLQLHRMKESTQDSKLCNCRQKTKSRPLDDMCLTKWVAIAIVTETTSNNQETYIGLRENEFKTRFNLHKSSLKLEHKRTSTTLSDHVWKLKKQQHRLQHQMGGRQKMKLFALSDKVGKLCLQEKLSIIRSAPFFY